MMHSLIENILAEAETAYKENVNIKNRIIEKCLLSIINDAQSFLNKITINNHNKTINVSNNLKFNNEIEKVHRKVPRWLKNPSQYNYKILTAYMKLSKNNTTPIKVSLLEKHSGIKNNKFTSHFNQMKIIAKKNHAKVFDEANGEVKLWEPVANFIVELYKQYH